MNVMKVKLLLATLLSCTVGTVGCAADHPLSTLSQHSAGALSDADRTAKESSIAGETAEAKMVSKSESSDTKNQPATSPAGSFAQASYHQPVQPKLNTVAAHPLTTLGPNDDLLEMVDQASGVVLLDFYADWCGPCRTQGGILHEMEQTASQNGASMIKVNVDQHRRLASALNVTSLPTLMLIKDGQIIERQSGVANHQRVAALLSK